MERKIFLTARWHNLIMVNYAVDPQLLQPYLPKFTQIDTFNGKTLVSLVGFMFRDTRVFGLQWPLHTHFEEVNLRFYVKHFNGVAWKRGVVFISEIVPSPVIAAMANLLYREPYRALLMRHYVHLQPEQLETGYSWKHNGKWNALNVVAGAALNNIESGSEEEFIFEHYWGYNRYDAATTVQYGVEHDRWQTHAVKQWHVDCDFGVLYGDRFKGFFSQAPSSVLLAHGSAVIIRKPSFLR